MTVTSRIPYKDPYVVKSQLVEQNDPFLINEIACSLQILPHAGQACLKVRQPCLMLGKLVHGEASLALQPGKLAQGEASFALHQARSRQGSTRGPGAAAADQM